MISKPYTLFIRLPLTKTSSGLLFCDPLWAKDLKLHFEYIQHLSLCCPIISSDQTIGLEEITPYPLRKIFPLAMDYGIASVVHNLIPNFLAVVRACRQSEIVHSDGSGWAFPLSFYLLLIRPFLRFKWIMVMESSFWRMSKQEKFNLRKVLEHYLHQLFLGWSVNSADARIFTQSFYASMFLGDDTRNVLISPATWINQDNFKSEEAVTAKHLSAANTTFRFVFPSRLIAEKGVHLLFQAVKLLAQRGLAANVTMIGEGPLKEECIAFAQQDFGEIKVTYFPPLEYGAHFFKFLGQFDAVLVTNLKEEQPRIIFDAFSQGVGVVAADTSGILDITLRGQNALIFNAGDAESLASSMAYAINHRSEIHALGLNGLRYARGKTHSQMHADRLAFLQSALA